MGRLSILLVAAAMALTPACTDPDCQDPAACELVGAIEGLEQHELRGRQSVLFTSGDMRYALVHYEYGVGQDCPAGCFYSHLCTFVVGGETRPFYFYFTRDPEVLPTVQAHCAPRTPKESDADCALPGLTLPILADPAFRTWATTESSDELRWCRHALARDYETGALPR
jgi:hypothetical protein